MNVDIDQFIREQKSKIAEERNYISKNSLTNKASTSDHILNNGDFLLKMREGENMKNKYKQELRNEFSTIKQLEMVPNLSSKKIFSNDNSDDEGLLHGLKYTSSASKRKEKIRNEEYNEFKAAEEEKFKNRFADKKNFYSKEGAEKQSYIKSNPISSGIPTSQSPLIQRRLLEPSQEMKVMEYNPKYSTPRMFESKIDELERKVEELRNFRVQNPFIIYPNDENVFPDNTGQVRHTMSQERDNAMRYSNTNLGQSHLRYLDETEKRLRDIEEKYDRRKHDIMIHGKTSVNKHPILDDEDFFLRQTFGSKSRNLKVKDENHKADSKSIIPTGRENNEEIKKMKQDEYRKELQLQMHENTRKQKNRDNNSNITFFDKFGQREVSQKQVILQKPVTNALKDQDYFFYASHNPLDEYDNNIVPSFNNDYPKENESVHNTSHPNSNKNKSNIFFGEKDNQSNKGTYRNELMKQIEETKIRKEIEKKKLEDYERRKNEEIARYEPFGRGGGGAPLKNDKGETISDLKRIQFEPDIVKRDPPAFNPNVIVRPDYQNPISSDPLNSQRGFARGGNGIFGNALSDEDKLKAERYKEDLKIQIEKNRRQKEIDKESERIREENERMKFERDQKQIQIELENERKRQQEKEIEHQRLLEESKANAFKEKERINKSKIENEKRNEERINSTRAERETKREERIFSPLIRKQTPQNDKESLEDHSKLEIEAISRAQINREDSKIMSQLYKLKNQLESEKLRVEQALIRQRDDVEIYDPRLNKNNPFKVTETDSEFNSDIFQAIVDNKKPLTVRRDHLKNKSVTPRNHKNTEAKFDEYLKQQEKILERMYQNDFSKLELMMPKMEPHHVGLRPSTQMSNQLESDSAFIRFDQSNDFHLRNSISQASDMDYSFIKPRSPKLSEFGSNTSLNIDELTRKNQQRLRKLQRLQDENDSNQSSEDILNKIVAKNNND